MLLYGEMNWIRSEKGGYSNEVVYTSKLYLLLLPTTYLLLLTICYRFAYKSSSKFFFRTKHKLEIFNVLSGKESERAGAWLICLEENCMKWHHLAQAGAIKICQNRSSSVIISLHRKSSSCYIVSRRKNQTPSKTLVPIVLAYNVCQQLAVRQLFTRAEKVKTCFFNALEFLIGRVFIQSEQQSKVLC